MILPSSAIRDPATEHDVDGNRSSMSDRFDTEPPSYAPAPIANDAETERDSMDERFDAGSPAMPQSPAAGGHEIADDDSPPPTHFVEIKLTPVVPAEAERPALPEESPALTMATPPQVAAAPTPTPGLPPVMEPVHHAPAQPKISLELPPDSDLVLVETVHQKAVLPMPEEAEALRPRRVRPPRVEVADGPLQLVETTHKESTPPGA
jgi:hypothetical protein